MRGLMLIALLLCACAPTDPAAMIAAGFVITERDKWTMIRGEYGSLAYLLDALKTGRAGTL